MMGREFSSLSIYGILGRKVRTLVSRAINTDTHKVVWGGCSDSGLQVSSRV